MSIPALRIRTKLGLVSALLLLPIALLAWLFIEQSFKDIRFAEKELSGTAYLRGVWAATAALVEASSDKSAPQAWLKNGPSLGELGRTYDATMDSGEASKTLADALRAVGWPNAALARDEKTEKAIADARTLLTKVADNSNLTLDPDLDSYYLMDATTIKLPEMLDRAGTVLALARAHRAQKTLNDDDKAELMIQIGLFASAASGTVGSLDSAYKGNASGDTRKKLSMQGKEFAGVTEKFAADMKALAVAMRDDGARAKLDLGAITALYRETTNSANALWLVSTAELDRLLDVRIDGFKTRLWMMLSIAAVVTLAALAMAFFISRQIANPLIAMKTAMTTLASGQHDIVVPGLGRKDEIGEISQSLQILRDSLAEADHTRIAQEDQVREIERDRKAAMRRLAQDFEAAVGNIVETVSATSGELEQAATTLTRTAETTQQLSDVVASASQTASANVQSVSSAAQELSGTVTEIARRVQESTAIANEAVQQASNTDSRIGQLSQAASRIGDVVKLITAIAEQTNLLALNATIEAARAGEAGRGFAVVASEVKALAAQTGKATEEISGQIAAMQTATQDSVTAIKEIGGTIGRISEIAAAIAAAVEEQGAATGEISRGVQQAADGAAKVASNITDVNRGAGETGTASARVLTSAQSLSSESNRLKQEVGNFLASVRAA